MPGLRLQWSGSRRSSPVNGWGQREVRPVMISGLSWRPPVRISLQQIGLVPTQLLYLSSLHCGG